MSEYLRARVAGGTYLFTVNTRRRLPILANAELRAALRHGIETFHRYVRAGVYEAAWGLSDEEFTDARFGE